MLGFAVACVDEPSEMAEKDAPLAEHVSCADDSARAVRAILDAAASVTQCTTHEDCKPLGIDATCWDSCATRDLAGNEATQQAIDSVSDTVADICQQFADADCKVIASGCPGRSDKSRPACKDGKCTILPP
jgi:hypothetical protein